MKHDSEPVNFVQAHILQNYQLDEYIWGGKKDETRNKKELVQISNV